MHGVIKGDTMPRIAPVEDEHATPEQQANIDAIVGRVTNMKRTLARSRVALHALLEWYPLHDVVLPFLGERSTSIFCHAISTQSDCLICSTYFRRELLESGISPDDMVFSDKERVLVDFGRQIARDANGVEDELFERLRSFFSEDQIVDLTAFGALMIATNVFNDALRVDLDDELEPFRAAQTFAPV
jgi:alkylhydroperoxidase family enzyme